MRVLWLNVEKALWGFLVLCLLATGAYTSNRVQFRVYFAGTSVTNAFAGWNSGNTPGSEPQLVIEYAD